MTYAEHRHAVCAACPTKCSRIPDLFDHRSECPLSPPRWGPAPKPRRGLGDAAAAVAQPAARALDAVLGTDLQHCRGCKQRRADWNALVPDILHPLRRRE